MYSSSCSSDCSSNYTFISYHVPGENATAMVTDTTMQQLTTENPRISLSTKLKHQFKEMEVQSK